MPETTAKERIVLGIRQFFENSGSGGVVFGLSGGLDSAATAYLLKEALGPEKITALVMPEKGITKKQNIADAIFVANKLGIKNYLVWINPLLKAFEKMPWKQSSSAKANIKARARMAILYNYANSSNFLVAGTSNKTELLLGYFTKYGDGAADFLPIASLFKGEVRELAGELGVPKKIIDKTPSAELWKGQTDEKEIGLSYEKIDLILKTLIDEKRAKIEIVSIGILPEEFEIVAGKIKSGRHKREMPRTI